MCYTVLIILNTEDTNMQQSRNNDLQIHLKKLNENTKIKEATMDKKNSSQKKNKFKYTKRLLEWN